MASTAQSGDVEKITVGRCLCGAVSWTFVGEIPDATICNCTACRRYGVLWAYGHDGHGVHVEAPEGGLTAYRRSEKSPLTFNFCKSCGSVICWRGTQPSEDGRIRLAVNLRLAEPETVAHIPLLRFDGLDSFEDIKPDGRCVGDVWF